MRWVRASSFSSSSSSSSSSSTTTTSTSTLSPSQTPSTAYNYRAIISSQFISFLKFRCLMSNVEFSSSSFHLFFFYFTHTSFFLFSFVVVVVVVVRSLFFFLLLLLLLAVAIKQNNIVQPIKSTWNKSKWKQCTMLSSNRTAWEWEQKKWWQIDTYRKRYSEKKERKKRKKEEKKPTRGTQVSEKWKTQTNQQFVVAHTYMYIYSYSRYDMRLVPFASNLTGGGEHDDYTKKERNIRNWSKRTLLIRNNFKRNESTHTHTHNNNNSSSNNTNTQHK